MSQPESRVEKKPAGSVPDGDLRAATKLPTNLPGYKIERALGHGGMGTVYLGRQISLDRPVALKVMSKRWSMDAIFVARFTREAFAAALLNHPNVVQIYDIGEADGTRFFSMEYVPGRSLADLVKSEGKVDPEIAVGYVLQAARGLKHAHDRGMIHRDVKPDNLLLSDQGIVKVADLGLVKTPGSEHLDKPSDPEAASKSGLHAIPPDMTGVRMALGTPAYMAPEQCRDAAAVDHRADIYSLGCTLYVLVTGKPPFEGHTAVELMTKHAYEPLTPPERVVNRVPKELSAVIMRMMAKNPGDRFADMGEVIRVLEQWLGVHHTGTFAPRDDQIDQLEICAFNFHTAPAAVLRNRLIGSGLAVSGVLFILLTFFGRFSLAMGIAGMVVQGLAAYFVMNGVGRRTYLFRRTRQFLSGFSLGDWMVVVGGVGLFALLLAMLGLFWMWVGFGLIGIAIAATVRYGLDRTVDAQRLEPLESCEKLLRRMRANGVDEEEIRQFIARFSGRHWEEFFEALFGFEAKLAARALLLRGGSAGEREKFAAWREPLLGLIEGVEKHRQAARERAMLARVEQARLQAAGVAEPAAKDQAAAAAEALVQRANEIREKTADAWGTAVPTSSATISASGVPNLTELLAGDPIAATRGDSRGPVDLAIGAFVGPHVRTMLAAVLLACCTLWVQQNQVLDRGWEKGTQPLAIAGVPAKFTDWCNSVNAGWAGVLLLVSLLYRGNLMATLVLLGSAVAAIGHIFQIRTVEPVQDTHVSLILGTVFCLVGYRLGRR